MVLPPLYDTAIEGQGVCAQIGIPPDMSMLRRSLTASVGVFPPIEESSGSWILEVWRASRGATEGAVGDVMTMLLLCTWVDTVTVTVLVRVLLNVTIRSLLLTAVGGDSFAGVLSASFGAVLVSEVTTDAESMEGIEAIELDELGEEVILDKLFDIVTLVGDAVVKVLAGKEDGAALSVEGLPVHGMTVTTEALSACVSVKCSLMLLTSK